MFLFPVVGLVLLVLLCFVTYLVVRNRWYIQALLVAIALFGLVCSAIGLRQVTDSLSTNDLTGTLLLVIGIAALLGDAVLIMKFMKGRSR